VTFRIAAVAALIIFGPVAAAQERIADYDNSVRVEYQFIHTGALATGIGPMNIGETDAHVVLLSGTYSLSERWKVYGAIPYVQKRHQGPGVHDPVLDFYQFEPPDLRLIDDGDYHGGFQDIHAVVHYLAIDGPFSLSPFLSYGVPVSDYPTYGNAAIGKQLWEVPVGVSMEFTPNFSDWFFRADVSYVFSEELLGVDLDYWLTYLAAAYYVTPRFVPRIFLTSRNAPDALRFPEDFTDDYTFSTLEDFDNEYWYQHDRTLRHNYINAGIGFDYIVNDRYSIAATYFQTIDPEDVAEVEYAVTFALIGRF
jgi:hypothetical protein